MADRNPARQNQESEFTGSDPLSELTHAMESQATRSDLLEGDDLGLDLERELMRDLDASLEASSDQTPGQGWDDLDAFSAALEDAMPPSARDLPEPADDREPDPARLSELERGRGEEVDASLDAAFDAIFADHGAATGPGATIGRERDVTDASGTSEHASDQPLWQAPLGPVDATTGLEDTQHNQSWPTVSSAGDSPAPQAYEPPAPQAYEPPAPQAYEPNENHGVVSQQHGQAVEGSPAGPLAMQPEGVLDDVGGGQRGETTSFDHRANASLEDELGALLSSFTHAGASSEDAGIDVLTLSASSAQWGEDEALIRGTGMVDRASPQDRWSASSTESARSTEQERADPASGADIHDAGLHGAVSHHAHDTGDSPRWQDRWSEGERHENGAPGEQFVDAMVDGPRHAPETASAHDADFDFDFDLAMDASDHVAGEDLQSGRRMERAQADGPDASMDDMHEDAAEAEELDFDVGEFEAALADELAAGEPESTTGEDREDLSAPADASPDPFAALATMGLASASSQLQTGAASAHLNGPSAQASQERTSQVPQIDTVDVPEEAVALADDLDIPDVAHHEDTPHPVHYDDLDAEIAQAYAAAEPAAPIAPDHSPHGAEPTDDDFDFDHIFARPHGTDQGVHPAGGDRDGAARYDPEPRITDLSDWSPAADQNAMAGAYEAADARLSREEDEAALIPPPPPQGGGPLARNRLAIASAAAGLVIIGGIGALALTLGGDGDAPPALVQADGGPVKVKPENPGGVVVPNQDNKVYERVASGQLDAPEQQTLISTSEEPVDIAAPVARPLVSEPDLADQGQEPSQDALPGINMAIDEVSGALDEPTLASKNEDRVPSGARTSAAGTTTTAAIAPRKVRTLIVRPDGTLVEREDSEPDASDQVSAAMPAPAGTTHMASLGNDAAALVQAEPAQTAADDETDASTVTGDITPPAQVPLAPSRPGEQPVDIVGEVSAGDQLAAVNPSTEASSGWSMQIASQPSAESAQATYQDLARRFGNVLGGRGVNIVKADIAGKGTFWRVRVPVASRDEGTRLCSSYKAAGGSCFIAR